VALCAGAAAADEPAGFVKSVSGEAFIERNQAAMPAKVKDILTPSDTLVTGSRSSMGIILQDNSVMSIGSNTRLVISEFQFKPAEQKLSFIAQVVKGKVVYLTGLIAKLNSAGIKFQTPTAVCGVRGTRFAISVEEKQN
jgi:hypothetical protein